MASSGTEVVIRRKGNSMKSVSSIIRKRGSLLTALLVEHSMEFQKAKNQISFWKKYLNNLFQ